MVRSAAALRNKGWIFKLIHADQNNVMSLVNEHAAMYLVLGSINRFTPSLEERVLLQRV